MEVQKLIVSEKSNYSPKYIFFFHISYIQYTYAPLDESSNSEVCFDFCMIWGQDMGGVIWSPTMKGQKNIEKQNTVH